MLLIFKQISFYYIELTLNNIHKQKKAALCILLFTSIYTKLNKITVFKQHPANFL